MTWIATIDPEAAKGRLKATYEGVARSSGKVDNIIRAHSLRPHTLDGHLALYRSVLHHSANTTPMWLLEAVGVYVSALNGCGYCVAHHRQGLRRHLADDPRGHEIERSLLDDRPDEALAGAELAAMPYARALTLAPASIDAGVIDELRTAGLDNGAILEINQVASYFAYANRTVLGLGVTTEGEHG